MASICILPTLTTQVTTFGAGCAAALSAQKLYQLSPTAQLRRVKNLLDETRLLLDKLQRQNPGGIEGHSNDYKPYPALQRIYAGCENRYINRLEKVHASGWTDFKALYGSLVELRDLLEHCTHLRNDALRTTNLINREDEKDEQARELAKAQRHAWCLETAENGIFSY